MVASSRPISFSIVPIRRQKGRARIERRDPIVPRCGAVGIEIFGPNAKNDPDRVAIPLFERAGEEMAYKPIESYGIIGDCHTVALVGMDGSIDCCCLPHFDSPSIFASILDEHKGGFFKIASLYEAQLSELGSTMQGARVPLTLIARLDGSNPPGTKIRIAENLKIRSLATYRATSDKIRARVTSSPRWRR
jgi:hypothetical protein